MSGALSRLSKKKTNRYFPRYKGVNKPRFGLCQRISYGFDGYVGVTITASLPLPHHLSATAIVTVTVFYHYAKALLRAISGLKFMYFDMLRQ